MDERVVRDGPTQTDPGGVPAHNDPASNAPAQPALLEIRAPAEQTEGTRSQVLRWLKSVGEPVQLNEPLIELETDKVTVEVPAPGSGVLQEILKQEQEEVEPGDLLGRIGTGGHGTSDAEPQARVADAAAKAASNVAPTPASAPAARTSIPAPAPVRASAPTPASAPAPVRASAPIPAASAPAARVPPPAPGTAARRETAAAPATHRLSPAVRRLLTEHSLDASSIEGSGEGGRITVRDVLQAAAGQQQEADTGAEHRVPHTAVRKRIAEHMVRSLLHTAPHVTTVFEADMSAVLRHRAKHRDAYASDGAPLTLTAYFLQACVTAIRIVPEVNSRWTPAALEISDSIHIGVATALQNELVVPVLRSVESLDLRETARRLHDLTTRAREGRLTPADVRGGTFTISNHGVSGSLLAAPIVINQPQSAILGVGKLEKRVIVTERRDREEGIGGDTREQEHRLVVQPRCYVTLTIDHRVLDGHRANQFLQSFVTRLADWPES